MLKLKKLHSKVFKKSSASPAPTRRDPKLRHSRSMPLRSTNETEDSYVRPRPVYRGEHPLQPSEINYVLDISPDAGWPRYDQDDDDDMEDTGSTNPRRFPIIDPNIVDAFPSPPTTLPNILPPGAAEPARPPRPPANDLDMDFDDYLIPDLDPRVKAKMATLSVIKRQEEHGTASQASGTQRPHISSPRALQPRQPQLRRSSSSTSRYWRPTTGYSKLAATVERDRARGLLPRNFEFDSIPRPSTSTGMYSSTAASQSTRSLADPRYRAALADHQRKRAAAEASSLSTPQPGSRHAIYGNATASQSTHALGPNARLRTVQADNHHPAPAIPSHQDSSASVDEHATVHRRNASAASSRSALVAKRLAIVAQTPPADAIEQQYDQQPRGAPRVARGMHGVKLQCPVPVRPVRFDLRVNELNGKEWVMGGNSTGGQPATVAGQGRGGVSAGRR